MPATECLTRNRIGAVASAIAAMALGLLVARASFASQPDPAPWRDSVRRFASEHFRHPAWGFSHSVRDYELATSLAREDHVQLDDDVLFAAAFLHDIAAFAPWDREKEGIDHADEGARVVESVLQGTGFPMERLEAVRAAIRTHMFDRAPSGPEATYLHDADALDWLGAIGAARIIATVDVGGGEPDGPKAVGMLEENLASVPAGVRSPAARRRLPSLESELRAFIGRLRAETDNLRTL